MSSETSWTPVELSPDSAPSAGAFSIAAHGAGLIFVSGQIPRDPVTGEWEKDRSFDDQAKRVFGNLDLAVKAAGAGLVDVVNVGVRGASRWKRTQRGDSVVVHPVRPAYASIGEHQVRSSATYPDPSLGTGAQGSSRRTIDWHAVVEIGTKAMRERGS